MFSFRHLFLCLVLVGSAVADKRALVQCLQPVVTVTDELCPTNTKLCPRRTVKTTTTDVITSTYPIPFCPVNTCVQPTTTSCPPPLTVHEDLALACSDCRTIPVTSTITKFSTTTVPGTCPSCPKTTPPITSAPSTTPPPGTTRGQCYESCSCHGYVTTIYDLGAPTPTGCTCLGFC